MINLFVLTDNFTIYGHTLDRSSDASDLSNDQTFLLLPIALII